MKETNRNAILNNNISRKNKNDLQLCSVYYELIQNLWDENGRQSYSPEKFLKVVDDISKNDVLTFKKGEAGDAEDFIIFILEQLHKELQKPSKNNLNQLNEPLNQYDKENTFKHFIEDFKENTSIISDIFYGINETNTICLNCKNNYNSKGMNNPICYNYGLFNCLIFHLEEVKKFKMQSMQNNFMILNINTVSLIDCFWYNQKIEYFTGQNRNYCNECKHISDAMCMNKIFSSPKYLILIMNRGKNNVFKIHLDFSEFLDLNQFVVQKDNQILYSLYGDITHLGENGPSGHFIAACRSPVDKKWYRFNDSIVTPIIDFNKEIYNFGMPYILFYEKVDQNNQNISNIKSDIINERKNNFNNNNSMKEIDVFPNSVDKSNDNRNGNDRYHSQNQEINVGKSSTKKFPKTDISKEILLFKIISEILLKVKTTIFFTLIKYNFDRKKSEYKNKVYLIQEKLLKMKEEKKDKEEQLKNMQNNFEEKIKNLEHKLAEYEKLKEKNNELIKKEKEYKIKEKELLIKEKEQSIKEKEYLKIIDNYQNKLEKINNENQKNIMNEINLLISKINSNNETYKMKYTK